MERKIEEVKSYRRKFYDERANIYDKLWLESRESSVEMDGFKELVKVENGDIVLDVATGTGIYLVEMAKDKAICYGIDISQKMLEKLRYKIKEQGLEDNVKDLQVCDADKLPYPENFFDLVTCIGLFEYYPIEYSKSVLIEIRRVLKPRKKCFIDIVDPDNKENLSREYLHKYDLYSFNETIRKIRFEIVTSNVADRMIQYLLSKED